MYKPMEELLDKVKPLAQAYLEGLGYDLVDLSLSRVKGGITLRFLADTPKGGISLKECADLNQGLGAILDRENILEGSYMLEVSSPGVDRPLVSGKDFSRAQGRRVRIMFSEPFEGRPETTGIIAKVEGDTLFLDLGEKIVDGERGRTIKIPLCKIKKAKQVIE